MQYKANCSQSLLSMVPSNWQSKLLPKWEHKIRTQWLGIQQNFGFMLQRRKNLMAYRFYCLIEDFVFPQLHSLRRSTVDGQCYPGGPCNVDHLLGWYCRVVKQRSKSINFVRPYILLIFTTKRFCILSTFAISVVNVTFRDHCYTGDVNFKVMMRIQQTMMCNIDKETDIWLKG